MPMELPHSPVIARRSSVNSPDMNVSPDAVDKENISNACLQKEPVQAANNLKRKHPISTSCELCKHRKVKCDRAHPSCGWCAKHGQPCEYKERKKSGIRAGYGRELERRLGRLEGIIQAHNSILEKHISRKQSRTPDRWTPSSQIPQLPVTPPSDTSPLPTSPISDHGHLSIISPPSMNEETPAAREQAGPSLANRCSALSSITLCSREPGNSSSMESREVTKTDVDLPYDLLFSLVNLYFEHINTWCPILHRRKTLDSIFGPFPMKEEDRVLLHAIAASALPFSKDPRLNEDNRKSYHEASKKKVMLHGSSKSSIKTLQALVILSLDFVESSHGPPDSRLLSLMTKSIVQAGLAQESTTRTVLGPNAWIEEEERRRLFWMAYLLDRFSSFAAAVDLSFDDQNIERRLPCQDECFVKGHPTEIAFFQSGKRTDAVSGKRPGSFGLQIEIIGIFSRIHCLFKRPVDVTIPSEVQQWRTAYQTLDDELSHWEINLPSAYAFDKLRLMDKSRGYKRIHCGWIMLHAAHQTSVIRLHSSVAYPIKTSSIFSPCEDARRRCVAAVENISVLAHHVVDNNMLSKLGPPFAFTLWVAARMLLIHYSATRSGLDSEVFFFVKTLSRLGTHWKIAERYTVILQRFLDGISEHNRAT